MSDCLGDMWLVKNWFLYLLHCIDYKAKESVIVCAHVNFSHWDEQTQGKCWSPKGATHMMQIQEMSLR